VKNDLCPESRFLGDYASGELDETEANRLDKHVAACDICGSLMERLRAFDSDENSSAGPEWVGVSGRMEARFGQFLREQGNPVKTHERSRFRRFLWNPIPAYAVMLALVYPAWLGLSNSHAKPIPPRRMENVRLIRLDATRSAQAAVAAVSDGTGLPMLSFFVPVRDGFQYRAAILDHDGKAITEPVSIQSNDGQGNFVVVCPEIGRHPEGVTLQVTEYGAGGERVKAIDFPFQP
jgi:anti-sigma factor RsiW